MNLLLEGDDLEALLIRARHEGGPFARIVRAEKVRHGGVLGFFAKEGFEVAVEVPGSGLDDEEELALPARPLRSLRSVRSTLLAGPARVCPGEDEDQEDDGSIEQAAALAMARQAAFEAAMASDERAPIQDGPTVHPAQRRGPSFDPYGRSEIRETLDLSKILNAGGYSQEQPPVDPTAADAADDAQTAAAQAAQAAQAARMAQAAEEREAEEREARIAALAVEIRAKRAAKAARAARVAKAKAARKRAVKAAEAAVEEPIEDVLTEDAATVAEAVVEATEDETTPETVADEPAPVEASTIDIDLPEPPVDLTSLPDVPNGVPNSGLSEQTELDFSRLRPAWARSRSLKALPTGRRKARRAGASGALMTESLPGLRVRTSVQPPSGGQLRQVDDPLPLNTDAVSSDPSTVRDIPKLLPLPPKARSGASGPGVAGGSADVPAPSPVPDSETIPEAADSEAELLAKWADPLGPSAAALAPPAAPATPAEPAGSVAPSDDDVVAQWAIKPSPDENWGDPLGPDPTVARAGDSEAPTASPALSLPAPSVAAETSDEADPRTASISLTAPDAPSWTTTSYAPSTTGEHPSADSGAPTPATSSDALTPQAGSVAEADASAAAGSPTAPSSAELDPLTAPTWPDAASSLAGSAADGESETSAWSAGPTKDSAEPVSPAGPEAFTGSDTSTPSASTTVSGETHSLAEPNSPAWSSTSTPQAGLEATPVAASTDSGLPAWSTSPGAPSTAAGSDAPTGSDVPTVAASTIEAAPAIGTTPPALTTPAIPTTSATVPGETNSPAGPTISPTSPDRSDASLSQAESDVITGSSGSTWSPSSVAAEPDASVDSEVPTSATAPSASAEPGSPDVITWADASASQTVSDVPAANWSTSSDAQPSASISDALTAPSWTTSPDAPTTPAWSMTPADAPGQSVPQFEVPKLAAPTSGEAPLPPTPRAHPVPTPSVQAAPSTPPAAAETVAAWAPPLPGTGDTSITSPWAVTSAASAQPVAENSSESVQQQQWAAPAIGADASSTPAPAKPRANLGEMPATAPRATTVLPKGKGKARRSKKNVPEPRATEPVVTAPIIPATSPVSQVPSQSASAENAAPTTVASETVASDDSGRHRPRRDRSHARHAGPGTNPKLGTPGAATPPAPLSAARVDAAAPDEGGFKLFGMRLGGKKKSKDTKDEAVAPVTPLKAAEEKASTGPRMEASTEAAAEEPPPSHMAAARASTAAGAGELAAAHAVLAATESGRGGTATAVSTQESTTQAGGEEMGAQPIVPSQPGAPASESTVTPVTPDDADQDVTASWAAGPTHTGSDYPAPAAPPPAPGEGAGPAWASPAEAMAAWAVPTAPESLIAPESHAEADSPTALESPTVPQSLTVPPSPVVPVQPTALESLPVPDIAAKPEDLATPESSSASMDLTGSEDPAKPESPADPEEPNAAERATAFPSPATSEDEKAIPAESPSALDSPATSSPSLAVPGADALAETSMSSPTTGGSESLPMPTSTPDPLADPLTGPWAPDPEGMDWSAPLSWAPEPEPEKQPENAREVTEHPIPTPDPYPGLYLGTEVESETLEPGKAPTLSTEPEPAPTPEASSSLGFPVTESPFTPEPDGAASSSGLDESEQPPAHTMNIDQVRAGIQAGLEDAEEIAAGLALTADKLALTGLGVPTEWTSNLPTGDRFMAVVQMLGAMPEPTIPDDVQVIAVVGPSDVVGLEAARTALDLPHDGGPRPVVTIPVEVGPARLDALDRGAATRPVVVSIPVDGDRAADAEKVREILQHVQAEAVIAVLDGTRPLDENRRWVADLGQVDAVALDGALDSGEPAAALQLGVPVVRLDGIGVDRVGWAAVLCAQLAVGGATS